MPRRALIAVLKIALLAVVLCLAGWKLSGAWRELKAQQLGQTVPIDWLWAPFAAAALAGVMFTGAAGWFWLLRRMEPAGAPVRLFGAYFFSQLGKYVPGKIMLLMMRLERTGPLGVSARAATIATLVENATYVVSGAAAGILALAERAGGQSRLAVGVFVAGASLLVAVHPAVFYRLVNAVLRKAGRPQIEPGQRLRTRAILTCVLLMVPCWIFGGIALWSTARCVAPVGIEHVWRLGGAFALSVVLGMMSLLPGGLGVREVTQGVLLVPVLLSTLPPAPAASARAQLLAALIVVLQRLLQLTVELTLGLLGGLCSRNRAAARGAGE